MEGQIKKSEGEEAPKCDLRWEDDHFIAESETSEDRDRAAKALEEEICSTAELGNSVQVC
jgi:hypothetical protein